MATSHSGLRPMTKRSFWSETVAPWLAPLRMWSDGIKAPVRVSEISWSVPICRESLDTQQVELYPSPESHASAERSFAACSEAQTRRILAVQFLKMKCSEASVGTSQAGFS